MKPIDLPIGWDPLVGSFVSGLLRRKPQQRLGANGPLKIKAHPWLSDIDWSALRSKKLIAPFIPSVNLE